MKEKPDPTKDWLDRAWNAVGEWVGLGICVALLFGIPVGSLVLMVTGYLYSGVWDVMTLADVTGWPQGDSEWVGANQIYNWAIAQWVGFHSFIAGFLVLYVITALR